MRVALRRRHDGAPLAVVLLVDPVAGAAHDGVGRALHLLHRRLEARRIEREQLADGQERAPLAGLAQRDVEDEACEERLRLVGPEAVVAASTVLDDEHLGDARRVVRGVGRALADEAERVEPAALDCPLPYPPEQLVRREPKRVERDHAVAEHARAVARREHEVLALRVRHDDRAGMVQEVRDDRADALARARRGDGEHVARAVVAEQRRLLGRRARRDLAGLRWRASPPPQHEPLGRVREHVARAPRGRPVCRRRPKRFRRP